MHIKKIMLFERQCLIWIRQMFRWRSAGLLLICLSASSVYAQTVEAILPNGIVATADFRPAAPARPAIVLIHGFLQTPNYLTTISLANAVADAGYTLLAPTLSLGINKRRKSLPCEALHLHTLQDDVKEIAYWVDWLATRGYRNIVMVGHSYGSLQSLVYVSGTPNTAVNKIIATSLVDFEHSAGEDNARAQIGRAQAALQQGINDPIEFPLSYCKTYVAPATAFLSYAEYTKPGILKAIANTKIPLEVILGSNDKRMALHWPRMLRENHAHVSIIEGANHFFDAEHEFDLIDRVLALIDGNQVVSPNVQPF